MKKERLYLLLLLAIIVSTLLIVGLFNALIDPHRFFNLIDVKGLNQYKTYVTKMRLRKPVHIYQRKPTIVIMGSSRAGGGLHCEDFTSQVDTCYNTALRGITTYEQFRMLEHVITVADAADKKIERIVLKISYATFTETDLTKEGFEETLSAHEGEGISFAMRKTVLEKYFYALFSWEALTDSRMTIKYQDKPFAWRATSVWNFEKDGSWKTYPLPQYENDLELIHTNRSKQWETSAQAMKAQFAALKNQLDQHKNFEQNYYYFDKLLNLAYRHHIQLDIMFPPEHAEYLLLMDEAGIWNSMEEWKRRIVAMNEQIADAQQLPAFRIWDFGGINQYSTEKTWDKLSVRQSMHWYEDIVHFQGDLGAKMLVAVRDSQTESDWFEVVTGSTIERHLEKIRHDKDNYKKNRVEQVPLSITKDERDNDAL